MSKDKAGVAGEFVESLPNPLRKKDGTLSKMRSHGGNVPSLPQNKICPHCSARFTRNTHLNRHMRNHTNERTHCCDLCDAQFTRSDLLTRHRIRCNNQSSRPRRKSCMPCTESKIKCDREFPCAKCSGRGKECAYSSSTRKPPTRHKSSAEPSSSALTSESLQNRLARPLDTSSQSPSLGSSFRTLRLSTPQSSVSASSHTATTETETETETDTEFRSGGSLSSTYRSDMFEPLFNNLFGSPSVPSITNDPEYSPPPDYQFPFMLRQPENLYPFINVNEIDIYGRIFVQPVTEINAYIESCTRGDLSTSGESLPADLEHYLYLFFTAFLAQMPLIHFPTFTMEDKPAVLIMAMRACGALFLRTRKSNLYLNKVLSDAWQIMVQEFDQPTSTDVVHLIVAGILLQTLGLFHQRSDQRANSSVYHSMLVTMIRRTGLMTKTASWMPGPITDDPVALELQWKDWVLNEMIKRSICMNYLHDASHCIYFALTPSYDVSELVLNLPCDTQLWQAGSAAEWSKILHSPSKYGSIQSRLTGPSMPYIVQSLWAAQALSHPIVMSPFALFVLTHTILQQMYSVCVDSRLPQGMRTTTITADAMEQQIFALQFALHNWLQCWNYSPDTPDINSVEEPAFLEHALQFYWLAQISLVAYQEGLLPFEHNSASNLNMEVRFRLVKHWLKHIRAFLKTSNDAPTKFWDELMKIRLQAWQFEMANQPAEDEGLLAFFPEQ
ncbi:hypothetical protein C8J56DRAFT_927340 [Mycena floridula]|nr:hypothetical protein C8J56DRAFT_927340 [Mycena floridula]